MSNEQTIEKLCLNTAVRNAYVLRVKDTSKYLVGTQKDLDVRGAKYFLETESSKVMTPLIGNTALDEDGKQIQITVKEPMLDEDGNEILDKKGKVKNFQLGICSIFVILAMIMACFNLNEIYSSIMILSGMMMVISTPFQEMKLLRENSNNRR